MHVLGHTLQIDRIGVLLYAWHKVAVGERQAVFEALLSLSPFEEVDRVWW